MFSSVFSWTLAGSRCECEPPQDEKRFYFLPQSFIFSSPLGGVVFAHPFKLYNLLHSGQDLEWMKAFFEIHWASNFARLPIHDAGHYLSHHSESTTLLKELRCTIRNSVHGFKVKIPKSYLLQYLPPWHQRPLFDLGLACFFHFSISFC